MRRVYKTEPECLLSLRPPAPRCRATPAPPLAAWRGYARKEMLPDGRAVLVMRPGGACGRAR